MHGSISVNAPQRKEAEESACGVVQDPAFKTTVIYFQEKILSFKFDLWLVNWFDLIRGNMILLIKNFHLEMIF